MSRGRIHDFILENPGEEIRDERGKWTRLAIPVSCRGRISSRGIPRSMEGGGTLPKKRAVAQIPLDKTVGANTRVVVSGLNEALNGTYRIEELRYTSRHYRALLVEDKGGA